MLQILHEVLKNVFSWYSALILVFVCEFCFLVQVFAHFTSQTQWSLHKDSLMPAGFLLFNNVLLQGSGLTSAGVHSSHPVAENARANVGALDVSDEREVHLFGKNQQKQTLHPHRSDLVTQEKQKETLWILNYLAEII